jgi:hypothetical protein
LKQKQYFFSPLSFGLDPDGQPNEEARRRCNHAIHFASRQPDPVFVLGGGMGAFAQKHHVYSLATASETYLRKHWGWMGEILNWGPYDNTNTVDEMITLYKAVLFHKPKIVTQGMVELRKSIARPVTSRWHAPRVWLICLIIFRKPVRVHMSRTTLPWHTVLREVVFHELPGFIKSSIQAYRKRYRRQD